MSLPLLSCPFEQEVSPYAARVDEHVLNWARRHALLPGHELDRFAGSKIGWLAARTSPRSDEEALRLLADWQMWLFVFDDRYCDESDTGAHPERLGRIVALFLRVLERADDAARHISPLAYALHDVVDRIGRRASDVQLFRFLAAVRGYFLAQFWEAGHRAEGLPAGLAEYQLMRRHSGAVPTCMALIDVADGFQLSDAEFCRADVRELSDIAVNVTCWANDIFSYPKEAARSTTVHSLPAVLARERGLSPAAAISAAAAMHDDELARYLALEPAVRRGASSELHRYLDGLQTWMSGNFGWSLETSRYGLAAAS
jgi:Terpene synthase family 2, C-terminal metal binding